MAARSCGCGLQCAAAESGHCVRTPPPGGGGWLFRALARPGLTPPPPHQKNCPQVKGAGNLRPMFGTQTVFLASDPFLRVSPQAIAWAECVCTSTFPGPRAPKYLGGWGGGAGMYWKRGRGPPPMVPRSWKGRRGGGGAPPMVVSRPNTSRGGGVSPIHPPPRAVTRGCVKW